MNVNKKFIIKFKQPNEQIFKVYRCANNEKSLNDLLTELNKEAVSRQIFYQIEIKIIERVKKYEKLSINFTH